MTKITNEFDLTDDECVSLAKARMVLAKLPDVLHTESSALTMGQTYYVDTARHVLDAILEDQAERGNEVDVDDELEVEADDSIEGALGDVQVSLGLLVEQVQRLTKRVMNP